MNTKRIESKSINTENGEVYPDYRNLELIIDPAI